MEAARPGGGVPGLLPRGSRGGRATQSLSEPRAVLLSSAPRVYFGSAAAAPRAALRCREYLPDGVAADGAQQPCGERRAGFGRRAHPTKGQLLP